MLRRCSGLIYIFGRHQRFNNLPASYIKLILLRQKSKTFLTVNLRSNKSLSQVTNKLSFWWSQWTPTVCDLLRFQSHSGPLEHWLQNQASWERNGDCQSNRRSRLRAVIDSNLDEPNNLFHLPINRLWSTNIYELRFSSKGLLLVGIRTILYLFLKDQKLF